MHLAAHDSLARRSPIPTVGVETSALRLSGVLAGLSHALDLTEGHPRGHAARTCRIGLRLGRAIGLSAEVRTELLYALLLKDAGCSSNAPIVHELFGGDDQQVKRAVWLRDWRRVPQQIAYALEYIGRGSRFAARLRRLGRFALLGRRGSGERIFTVRCERGAQIARMIGLSDQVADSIRAMDEHWDGGGYPYGLRGGQVPPLARIIGLAQVMEIFWGDGGPDHAIRVARERRGRWFEPALVDALADFEHDRDFWDGLGDASLTGAIEENVAADLEVVADEDRLDRIADAFALIIDAKSPFTFDHSRRVANYAVAINRRLGGRAVDAVRLHRAALLHDLGKLTVPNRILDKPGSLDGDEWAIIKQHPAFTLSVLERVPVFQHFAIDAANHHEWIDGHGYCRGLTGADLTTTARILAVADVVDALSADRPYRRGMPPDRVRSILKSESGTHFDEACVDACNADVIEQATRRTVVAEQYVS
jgi:putative nucleotidyltransferase with HDIG domain